uniref:Aberrant root formation protein 4 n=1 Tax=Oryza nivara TaxID=4536 RepID=A0A0E0I9V2_ORYNI
MGLVSTEATPDHHARLRRRSMDAGDTSAAAAVAPTPARLREALAALSKAFESGDCSDGSAAAAVSDLLNAAADAADADADAEDEAAAGVVEEMLREVHAFLSSPSSNQLAIDALSLELVKPVAKLGALMRNCWDIANAIIEFFVSNCNPRDMLSILCEAVDAPLASNGSVYFVLLFKELAKVLVLIQKRHTEQVKVTLPAVLRVMNAVIPECDEEHGKIIVDMYNAALRIGNAIQEMCKKMVNQTNEELCSVLSLYSLQNIALVSRCKQQHILSACGSVVLQHSKILTFCGFTYLGLLTGNDVTSATDKISKDEDADLLECFSFAMNGANLAVIWTYMDDEISKYAGAELESALKDVKGNHTRMWQAINILRYVLSSTHYPWVIKSHSLDLLLTIANESRIEEINDHVDVSSSGPQIFATLKTAILLDLVKDEVSREIRRADQDIVESDQLQDGGEWPPPWFSHALELVELILKPPEGGPPCLPDHGSRSRKMFGEETMRKVYSEWLMPLRPIVAGIQSESEEDGSDVANHIMCSLNPVQLVLYRCIELAEEKMKGF